MIVSIVGVFHAMSPKRSRRGTSRPPSLREEHLVGGAQPQEALEDEGDAVLHLQVGVLADDAALVARQSGGQFECQLAALGLAQDPARIRDEMA